jgi:hypothetical protein
MICSTIDGLFDPLYLHQIEQHVNEIPVLSNNIANRKTYPFGTKGTHRLLGNRLFERESMNSIKNYSDHAKPFFEILTAIEKELGAYFFLHEIALNVQHKGCDGTTHVDSQDPNDLTLLMMTNAEWGSSWGGQFQLTNVDGTEVIEEHEYVPGRVIVVPSRHPHRGLAPTEEYVYRTSVVWRVTPLDYYLRCNYRGRG